LPDRGTTLLFGWPDPLSPASWPWQANWIADGSDSDSDSDSDGETPQELDLFEAGELEGDEPLLADLASELGCTRDEARDALRQAASALTRASLLAATAEDLDDEDENEDDDELNGST
jgi:hypothetical protein